MHSTAHSIGIIGSGLAGLSAAIALRRAGHDVTIYESNDVPHGLGSSVSIASNGSRFFQEWGVNVAAARPVVLRNLIRHEWSSGEVEDVYPLGDYRERFGSDYSNFDSIELRSLLKYVALVDAGAGRPAILKPKHRAVRLDTDGGAVLFENGVEAVHDLILCADGSQSTMRQQLGIKSHYSPSTSSCYQCIISTDRLADLGLPEFADSTAIEFWSGQGIERVVMNASADYTVVSCYGFCPINADNLQTRRLDVCTAGKKLVASCPLLDKRLRKLFVNADEIRVSQLQNHDPYPYWVKGRCCLIGDAAHPMMPDQTQGACMAIEDAGALGIIFSSKYPSLSIRQRLRLYELERKPRATKLQESSRRSKKESSERMKWTTGAGRCSKVTIEEVCGYDMHSHIEDLAVDLGTGDQYW